MKIEFSAGADRDIAEAIEYYAAIRWNRGSDFLDRLKTATRLIQSQPYAGKLVRGCADLHELQIQRFPYRIIYRLANGKAEIIAVYHHKRRPLSWLWRAREEPAVYRLAA